MGNPGRRCSCPAALLDDPRPMGEGRHVALHARGGRRALALRGASAAAARCRPRPASPSTPPSASRSTATTAAVEPRLVLRHARPARAPAPIEVVGGAGDFAAAVLAELERALGPGRRDRAGGGEPAPPRASATSRGERHRRRCSRDLVASGEPVLVVAAHARAPRARAARPRRRLRAHAPGRALEDDPALAAPATRTSSRSTRRRTPTPRSSLDALPGAGWTHLGLGRALSYALPDASTNGTTTCARRSPTVFRALRAAGGPRSRGRRSSAVAARGRRRSRGARPPGRPPGARPRRARARRPRARRARPARRRPGRPARTALERSAAFRAYRRRLEDGWTPTP